MLAIPATQPQSERIFSTAGLTVIPERNPLDPDNMDLLVF
ncbi:unnamed protein product, partial [Discosporangium mesarthrocarpum]